MEAPSIVVSEKLSTRQASNVVFVSAEEILNTRQPAYTQSTTELAWLLRMPSASSIMVNDPYIQLEIEFVLSKPDGNPFAADETPTVRNAVGTKSAYGFAMEGFPFQSKVCRTSVVTVNGASQSYRNNECMLNYIRANASREFVERAGNAPWNDYQDQYILENKTEDEAFTSPMQNTMIVPSRAEAAQHKLFKFNTTGFNAEWKCGVDGKTKILSYREPLCIGLFGGLMKNGSFPMWSAAGNASPALLHMNQTQVSFQLHDNWYQNLFGLVQSDVNHRGKIKAAVIKQAYFCCQWITPPPKFLAAAISSQQILSSWKSLRFKLDPDTQGKVAPQESKTFSLKSTSYPYMPSLFCISVEPDYNQKLNEFAASGASRLVAGFHRDSKMDKRWGIYQLDLTVNVSPNVFPGVGQVGTDDARICNLKYSARQLYEMYKENTDPEKCLYSFHDWFHSGCAVLVTSSQMNGILSSAHCRGNVTISGKIHAVNTLGYACYVGDASATATGQDKWIDGAKMEKFEAQICRYYTNQYISIDAKSALLGESVMSEQFSTQLRLN